MMASKFRPSLLALSALIMLGSAAQAASLSANALGAEAAANVGATTATPQGYTDPDLYTNQNAYISLSSGNASGNAFSNQYGAYASRSNAQGLDAAGSSLASLGYSFTNTSGEARAYTLSFHIYGGYLGANLYAPALILDESLVSSYLATITVNGVQKFSSGATLTRNANGAELVKTGYDLGGTYYDSYGEYAWNGLDVSFDLGVLADGESFSIEALLKSNSFSNVGTYSYDDCGCGYYGGCPEAATLSSSETSECSRPKGQAASSYGDPLFIEGEEPSNGRIASEAPILTLNDSPVSNAVPEPGAYGLAALALLAAGWNRRRKQR